MSSEAGLIKEIELLRQRIEDSVGADLEDLVHLSRRLDRLIYEYQRLDRLNKSEP